MGFIEFPSQAIVSPKLFIFLRLFIFFHFFLIKVDSHNSGELNYEQSSVIIFHNIVENIFFLNTLHIFISLPLTSNTHFYIFPPRGKRDQFKSTLHFKVVLKHFPIEFWCLLFLSDKKYKYFFKLTLKLIGRKWKPS